MGERLYAEADILTEAAQINGMIVALIKVRADDFGRFEEDGPKRRWWSSVRSVATSESLAEISFSLRVRESCFSLVDCGVDSAVDKEANVVVIMDTNLLQLCYHHFCEFEIL